MISRGSIVRRRRQGVELVAWLPGIERRKATSVLNCVWLAGGGRNRRIRYGVVVVENVTVLRAVKGLIECIASASNLRRIQVRDIIKEVEDHLKAYSSAGMDISWYVDGIH
ncbi:hypothetical protein Tco_1212034 [Tanacetum coccineum]